MKVVSEADILAADRRIMGKGDAVDPSEDLWGFCAYNENTIYVRRVTKKFTKSQQLHTFWHEYFHMLLHKAGRERLSGDETLVDNLGLLQLQALQTWKI